jgi:hypothetical protein
MKTEYSQMELFIFIVIIINGFLEAVIMFIFDSDIYNFNKLSQTTTNIIKGFYNISNFFLVWISLYLLFVKKIKSTIAILICIILLFKGFFHFLVSLDLYKYLNLTKEEEQQLLIFHDHEALYTSVINIGLSSYLLYKIFLN